MVQYQRLEKDTSYNLLAKFEETLPLGLFSDLLTLRSSLIIIVSGAYIKSWVSKPIVLYPPEGPFRSRSV
jgi:hypothetical protein